MTAAIDDYHWLLSPAAEPWLAEAAGADTLRGGEMVRLVQRLRKSLSAERAHLIVEQVELRRRAKEKFSQAERMFFTRVGLEQATDERIAAHKAKRFAEDGRVADLCCGIGGDLLLLGQRGPATGVDASEIVAAIARKNCEVLSIPFAEVQCARAEEISLAEYDAWHIDPDRRPAGKRTTKVELHEPSLETLEHTLAANPNGAIKLAPAADLPPGWAERGHCEWIGSRGECRQLVYWHGKLGESGVREATIVDERQTSVWRGEPDLEPEVAASLGRYLYEPHAAILAARLMGDVAQVHGLSAVAPRVAYLTGDQRIDSPVLAGFEVLETLPFDLKRLAGLLAERNIGRVEVKKRGVEIDPLVVQKKLQTKAEESAVILLMPRDRQVLAVVARRLG